MIKTILLVEDDRDIRENMVEFLESEGYLIMSASNGKDALDILSGAKDLPAAILLDLMMPVMDGFGFREEQMKDASFASIPVLLMTANGQAETHAKSIGAHALIRKPIDIEKLSGLLKHLLD